MEKGIFFAEKEECKFRVCGLSGGKRLVMFGGAEHLQRKHEDDRCSMKSLRYLFLPKHTRTREGRVWVGLDMFRTGASCSFLLFHVRVCSSAAVL